MAVLTLVKLAAFQSSLASAAYISRQVQLGSDEYFLPPTPAWSLANWSSDAVKSSDEFIPLTVVELNSSASPRDVADVLQRYETDDDVWTPSFTQVIYAAPVEDGPVEEQGSDWIDALAPRYNISTIISGSHGPPAYTTVAPGPYFVHIYTGHVYEAYKLYVDTSQAFIQTSYQDPDGTHHNLRAAGVSAGALSVAVPSRLYFTPTEQKPLAGLRIAVKDLFDLKGMKTSFGNRALFETSTRRTETAYAVQKLIDAGAIVVGKNKLSEFAFAGPFVTENLDYLLPFNPRGDGYNTPGDSSGGSAAAVASYAWLDASMGSDTGGSVRGPAAVNGVHGNRPTQDAVDLTGALPLSPAMDTAGILARDTGVWSRVCKVLYADRVQEYEGYPSVVLIERSTAVTLENPGTDDGSIAYAAAVSGFIDGVTRFLSGNSSTYSIDEAWSNTAPLGQTLGSFTSGLYTNLTSYEQWVEFGRDFVEEYKQSHGGTFPHMAWNIRNGWWNAKDSIDEDVHQADLELKRVVADWADENFLTRDDGTCSNAIYLNFNMNYPAYKQDVSQDGLNPFIQKMQNAQYNLQSQITSLNSQITSLKATVACNSTLGDKAACEEATAVKARDVSSRTPPDQPINPSRFTSVAGLPDYLVTFGAVNNGQSSFSDSSLTEQTLPITVNIVAARGCDFMILNLVNDLSSQGIIKQIKAGSSVY